MLFALGVLAPLVLIASPEPADAEPVRSSIVNCRGIQLRSHGRPKVRRRLRGGDVDMPALVPRGPQGGGGGEGGDRQSSGGPVGLLDNEVALVLVAGSYLEAGDPPRPPGVTSRLYLLNCSFLN